MVIMNKVKNSTPAIVIKQIAKDPENVQIIFTFSFLLQFASIISLNFFY